MNTICVFFATGIIQYKTQLFFKTKGYRAEYGQQYLLPLERKTKKLTSGYFFASYKKKRGCSAPKEQS
ncbi:MAG: hypothetical protein D3910_05335 [Candidatus Electrothrix sp. ATG2]|nr:hypothetical protein [Candidatus Electrothrix sp. ATG2]